jgi:hypothetical protein
MSQYPGPDPDDPFSQPPNESGTPEEQPPPADAGATPPEDAGATPPADAGATPPEGGVEETAPIQREEMGYWEKKALEDQARLQQEAHLHGGQAGDQSAGGQQAGQPPPPPPPYGPQDPQQYGPPYQTPPPQDPSQGYGAAGGYGQYQQPPSGPYGQAHGQQYGYAYQVPNHPQATTALVLGLIGLIGGCLCGLPLLASPFAWAVGARAKREIEASHGQLGGAGNAQAGYIMGIIGTVLLVLAVLGLLLLLVVGIATEGSSGPTISEF